MNIGIVNRRRTDMVLPVSTVIKIAMNGVDWNPAWPQEDGWQEYREQHTGQPSGFLLYDDDNVSDYKIEIVDTHTGRADGVQTGDDSGIVPDAALRNSLARNLSGYGGVKFTGMDNGMTYQIEIVGSDANPWGWYTTYRIGGVEKGMQTGMNSSNSVVYTGVSPSSGEILMECKSTNGWGLWNAIILTEE